MTSIQYVYRVANTSGLGYTINMNQKIQFISTVEGLEEIEECQPKPAKYFFPSWFKDIPSHVDGNATVRHCPSFPDFFSNGYILPMWTDCILRYDKEIDSWSWKTASDKFSFDIHNNQQFLNHTKVQFSGVDGQIVFKAISPWRVITPPGWSVLQLPLFYHFNKEWSVLPGIIDTDIHSFINQQILYHGNNKKEILIKRGQPLVLYLPYYRESSLDLDIRYQTEEDKRDFAKFDLNLASKFTPNGTYRDMQRKRDKGK